ncbi:MAG TPA: UbiD family decarboxylase [Burkholderiales bacterium]|nr:UbiD family decarboxylase [Burkholderiales bacterium]
MNEDFRGFLGRLREERELRDITQAVDIRHVATLVDQADEALYFHKVLGYDLPIVSGIYRTPRRMALGMGCNTPVETEARLRQGLDHPVPPRYVETAPHKEVIQAGDDVDLFRLPIPMSSIYDGGPMITGGAVIARDPEHGLNSGCYRFLVKEKNLTGIDIVTPNNMRLFAQRALEAGRPCPISISLGTHPIEMMGAGFRAPLGTDEMGIAGGIRGEPVELVPCETVDVPCVAGAEIVLEGEILPTGWVWPEGRFGEFTRLMGGLHWNPLVRITAITRRRDAVYYSLHMPWENTWLGAPTRYAAIRTALKNAGVQVKDINVTVGGCAFWHAVISIRKQAGEGKNALLAALSVMDLKHVVVVDDDIDVFNGTDVEWAIATRVQGDRDVFVIPGTRAKPLDPSLPVMPPGVVPVGAKVGIDATIGEGIPRERFERISYAYADRVKLDEYVAGKTDEGPPGASAASSGVAALAQKIHALIEKAPLYYSEIVERFPEHDFQSITRAFGKLHADEKLWQDPRGRMCIRGSAFAAKPRTQGTSPG